MAEVRCKSGFLINQAEDDGEKDCKVPTELARLLEHEEKEIHPHKHLIEVINLGSDEVRRDVKIWASLAKHVHSELVKLLGVHVDVFAWYYQDMSGVGYQYC